MAKEKNITASESNGPDFKGGMKRPRAISGKLDPEKTRTAKYATGGGGLEMGGRSRNAGMMIDFINQAAPYSSGYKLDTYRSSYASGLGDRTGAYDIPTYFVMMNQQNGGLLYWPVTLAEKFSWYRYWSRSDAYIGRALELLSDLPMSKLTLNMPKMPEEKQALGKEILEFFEYQMEVLNMFETCQSVLWEWNMIGNCFPSSAMINTEQGMIPISDVKIGDKVLTHLNRYRNVVACQSREVDENLVVLDIQGIQSDWCCTSEHPVFVIRGGQELIIEAKEIRIGEMVSINGCKAVAEVVNVSAQPYKGIVYNLEVEEDHTYCVNNVHVHNCYIFHEWDDEKKMWSRAIMLPPEEVYVFQYPFSDNKRVEYRPERLIRMIRDGATVSAGMSGNSTVEGNTGARADLEQKILEHLPEELVEMVRTEGCIVMDTDPTTGSFIHHFARRRSPYMDLGASVLERVLVQMLCKEHYRYTQLSLASRNMTPKNLITAPGLMPDEVDILRTQIDLSYMDPDYSVITNYEVNWQQIGVSDRILDLDREYERIENQIFAGLGVTRELLTGEGSFAGNKITVEILNTMFLMTRELLRNYIEKKLFIPICEAHGWFEEGKNGIKKYFYPQVGFNRLTIRDNAEVFDSLFQLYQKGSLPVDIIYELFNLNVDEINTKLRDQLFTVKDSTSNRMSEEVNAEVGRKLVDSTDIVERIAKYLGLKMKPQQDQQGGMGGDMGGGNLAQGFADLGGEPGQPVTGPSEGDAVVTPSGGSDENVTGSPEEVPEAKQPSEKVTRMVDVISEAIPPEADEEDISRIVDKVSELDKEG